MPKHAFNILLLIARPAAGKSEVIDFLKHTPTAERIHRFHIADFEELDDFPMLWTWFEEDTILEEMGKPRLHTDSDGYFKYGYLWDLLIRRISLDYSKVLRDQPNFHQSKTMLIEFARGTQHGGFKRAFEHLSKEIVEKMAVMYINVSWEESMRKNQARYNPQRPDSILEHGLPNDKMEILYQGSDWAEISAQDPEFLSIQGIQVPYVVFENEDDVTTERGVALGQRLEETLVLLWQRYQQRYSR